MRVLAALLVLLACRIPNEIPVYLAGEASYSITNHGYDTVHYIGPGGSGFVAKYDSVCVHFHADGSWQRLVLSTSDWPRLELQWIPHELVRDVHLEFAGGGWRYTSTSPLPC